MPGRTALTDCSVMSARRVIEMIEPEQALQTIARITRRQRRELTQETRLQDLGLSSSLGLSTLRAALQRQFQVNLPVLHWSMTIAQVLGGESAAQPPAARTLGPGQLVGLGVDLEEVAGLAAMETEGVLDQHFTPAELTQARSHPCPREHLAGVFCAKEAVKKSHPSLLALEFGQIELNWDSSGAPTLKVLDPGLAGRFRFLVSISHTSINATATVLAFENS